ncbi:MAG: hypothetical protein R2851_29040 [Caldilineaceae bacterium]
MQAPVDDTPLRLEVRELLRDIGDLERWTNRRPARRGPAADLMGIWNVLRTLPSILELLKIEESRLTCLRSPRQRANLHRLLPNLHSPPIFNLQSSIFALPPLYRNPRSPRRRHRRRAVGHAQHAGGDARGV